ncbi:hypothetical protein ElyMa_002579800, partial [Elysia marginata]
YRNQTTFNKGDNGELVCSAYSNPDPTSVTLTRVRTKKVLANVQSAPLVYQLTSLDCLDTDVYVCSAQNSQGTTKRGMSIM